jgi:hypothetical protein
MKSIAVILVATLLLGAADAKPGTELLYSNTGDNTKGFEVQYGNLSFSSDGTVLTGASGGGYVKLPVTVNGDFQMSFDVFGDSLDVDSNIFILHSGTAMGFEVRNCPQDTDTPGLFIHSGTHFSDYQGYYWDNTVVATVAATNFPVQKWTHVVITKEGSKLTDNVGGQILTTGLNLSDSCSTFDIGLGYYATPNLGGAGQIRYRNIKIIKLAPPASQ